MIRTTAFLLLALLARPAGAELPPPLAAAIAAHGIPESAVGIVVQRLPDGSTVLAHNADRGLAPGSTLKLLTAAVALERLGPAHRWRTQIRATAPVVDGVLHGDLVLRGLGDVDLDWRAFDRMLERLRHRGLREIRGNLVVDLAFFEPSRPEMGLPPFDEAPEFRYNVVPDALMLNANLVEIDLHSDRRGVRAHLATPLDRVSVVAEMTLADRPCPDWEDGWKIPEVRASGASVTIVLRGDYPRDCDASTAINVLDRIQFTDRLFRALWQRRGGTFRGRTVEGPASQAGALLVEHLSRPLAEVLRDVNKRSDNPITRVVYLTLGALSAERAGEPTARRSEATVREWLQRKRIDQGGLVLENGSGLSRAERISPLTLAGVLREASRGPWGPEFVSSVPIAGVDGSMRKRLPEGPAAGRARLKTGTLRDTSGIAGYLDDGAGGTYVLVAIVNHALATREVARPMLDEFVDWFARRAPRPAS